MSPIAGIACIRGIANTLAARTEEEQFSRIIDHAGQKKYDDNIFFPSRAIHTSDAQTCRLIGKMMIGKRSGFTLEDFKACANSASMKRGRAETIIADVREVVARWRDYADESSIKPGQRDKIAAAPRQAPMMPFFKQR